MNFYRELYFSIAILAALSAIHKSAARETPLQVRAVPGPLLVLMTNSAIGVTWTNNLPEQKYIERQNLMNGAGVALGDFDGDGRCDVFLCKKFGSSALYRNLGNWQFEEVASRAGVTCTNITASGAVFADADGDGKLDLLVTAFQGPNAYFRNLGNGVFTNLAEQAGFKSIGGATSQALSDLDGDGDLDIYENRFAVEALLRDGASFSTRMVRGQPVVTGRFSKRLKIIEGKVVEFGEPDVLYRNDGGKFTPLKWEEFFSDEAGQPVSPPPADFGLSVQIRDVDLDGDPDIYTCNDFQTPDHLWLNDGKGRFREAPAMTFRNRSYASMGVDFADIDRDGDLDFITVEMLSRDRRRHLAQASPMTSTRRAPGEIENREDVPRNGLYINRGDGTYAETAWFSGLAASDWSWTPIFADLDLDGYEDLLISNGHIHDVNDRDAASRVANLSSEAKRGKLRDYPRLDTSNAAYRNRGNLTFEDVSERWGFDSKQITHGMALGDLDGDGDLDVVGNCHNAGPLFYQNNSAGARVAVRLSGRNPNTHGIGARVRLTGAGVDQIQEMISGGRYLSGDESMRVFAAGTNSSPLALEVTWRDGKQTRITAVKPNTLYEIEESTASVVPSASAPSLKPWFEDVSVRLNHTNREIAFDDFERQPLLPRRYSQLGPGLAWIDLSGDGADELVIGAARGETLSRLQNDGRGNFTTSTFGDKPVADDTAGIVGTVLNGKPVILAAIAHYESGQAGPPVRIFDGEGARAVGTPLPANASPGPLATGDLDGDGDLDLFVGGRIQPGNYPAETSAAIYRNEKGVFTIDQVASDLVRPTGMITAAVFSDLDSDGFPELVTAEEWGPIRIYRNSRGSLVSRTEADARAGWWNSVTTGDLNNDGRLDIIAGNWGRNSHYERGRDRSRWLIYFGDLEPGVQGELIEAYTEDGVAPVRDLQTLSVAMPTMRELFPSHTAFASAKLESALVTRLDKAQFHHAATLDSMILLNEGGNSYRAVALPDEAQWSPVFGNNIADFDNDGFNDVFLAQNFFAVRPEDDRLDAGRGLLLRGSADGKLVAVPGQISGLRIYGEQRGSAVGDFDRDGRIDLAVAQNGAQTKLYRNSAAPAGIRVRFQGSEQNPYGYGVVLRPRTSAGWGSAREIHGGSGYWSQDSPVQIVPATTSALQVRWPGGKETETTLPAGVTEVTIDVAGRVSTGK